MHLERVCVIHTLTIQPGSVVFVLAVLGSE